MSYSPQTWTDGPAGGTPISAARLTVMEQGIQVASGIGEEIDSAEIATYQDMTSTGVTDTQVSGGMITIPARTRPFRITFKGMAAISTGATTAANVQHGLIVKLRDVTAGYPGTDYDYGVAIRTQITANVNRAYQDPILMDKWYPPNASTRIFQLYARTWAAISGGSTVFLYGGDVPTSDSYPPCLLLAVGL